jgi:Xaa-Pro aminopeptidase
VNGRIDSLRLLLDEPLLVLDRFNLRYLTGFDSSNAALLVAEDELTLYSDFRYAAAARAVGGVEFVETRRALLADLAERLFGRIAFEANSLSYAGFETLSSGAIELVPRHGLVEGLRAVKDEEEISAIRRAAEISTRALERLIDEPFVGRTERELAWRLETLMRELGAERLAFEIGLGTGSNSALPHPEPGERRVQAGDAIVVDAGAVVDGYCSDCTRTFAAGEVPEWLERAYAVCLEAQLAGLGAVRPGVTGLAADRVARAVVEEAGLAEAFGHGLGHGVGLLVHEGPRLSQESEDVLAEGNVVSVEPGIYLEEVGGVRIEDLVVVREGGPEILTGFTKELVTLH